MHIDGLIPLISVIVQPIAIFYSLSTLISLSSCKGVSSFTMITSNVSYSPKNTYFKWSDNGFNSKVGAYKMEGRSFLLDKGKSINETSNLAFLSGSKCRDSHLAHKLAAYLLQVTQS